MPKIALHWRKCDPGHSVHLFWIGIGFAMAAPAPATPRKRSVAEIMRNSPAQNQTQILDVQSERKVLGSHYKKAKVAYEVANEEYWEKQKLFDAANRERRVKKDKLDDVAKEKDDLEKRYMAMLNAMNDAIENRNAAPDPAPPAPAGLH